jgi:hypothetical protein
MTVPQALPRLVPVQAPPALLRQARRQVVRPFPLQRARVRLRVRLPRHRVVQQAALQSQALQSRVAVLQVRQMS